MTRRQHHPGTKSVRCRRCADYMGVPVTHPDNGNLCARCEQSLRDHPWLTRAMAADGSLTGPPLVDTERRGTV